MVIYFSTKFYFAHYSSCLFPLQNGKYYICLWICCEIFARKIFIVGKYYYKKKNGENFLG